MTEFSQYPGMPRWMKVTAAIFGILFLFLAIVIITGIGGTHGPSRHAPSSSATEPGSQ